MITLDRAIRHSLYRRFPRNVRLGWGITRQAVKTYDMPRLGFGLALMGYGYAKKRSGKRLIYKTSIDAGQGTTIRVVQGRRPIAETAPLP